MYYGQLPFHRNHLIIARLACACLRNVNQKIQFKTVVASERYVDFVISTNRTALAFLRLLIGLLVVFGSRATCAITFGKTTNWFHVTTHAMQFGGFHH